MGGERWCRSCTRRCPVKQTELGHICCTACGMVLDEDMFSNEPVFEKDGNGEGRFAGNILRSVQSELSSSIETRLRHAYEFITIIVERLGIGGGDRVAIPAKRLYKVALEQNFVQGRQANIVAAVCLYIACREDNKPFLLIEFSEFLRTSVYALGAVFLQLCKVLHLEEHPIVKKPVDPSLFVHRFVHQLLGMANQEVEKTALRIVTSMKRDWMQTGRKPSGICGAALYLSALSHGFKFSKSDIVKIVHICEGTLTKRLIELEETESGGLTIDEFNQKAEEVERDFNAVKHMNAGTLGKTEEQGELLCEHKGSGAVLFAHGLCKTCYDELVRISGGLYGGSEPPAFQRGKRQRLAKNCAKESGSKSFGGGDEYESVYNVDDKSEIEDSIGSEGDESDNLSDIDDTEMDDYINTEKEKQYKEIIWMQMNAVYLKEQAEKEALAALAAFTNESGGLLVESVAKAKRKRKQAAETNNVRTAAEATHQMLMKKRLNSKVNFDNLKGLFGESNSVDSTNPTKSEPETHSEQTELSWESGSRVEDKDNVHEETMDEFGRENNYGDYQNDSNYHGDYQDDPTYYFDDDGDFDDGLC